eukprot:2056714-Rhodomonas_salina.1
MRAVVTLFLICTSFHPGQPLRVASPGVGLRLVNYSGSPCCSCSPSTCSLSACTQEPEFNSVARCGSLAFSSIRTVGCNRLWTSSQGLSASGLHDILGARRRTPYTTCLLSGGFSPESEGSEGLELRKVSKTRSNVSSRQETRTKIRSCECRWDQKFQSVTSVKTGRTPCLV